MTGNDDLDRIRFAVALAVGRDLSVASECCSAGRLCRHEVRRALGDAPDSWSTMVGETDHFRAAWAQLKGVGMEAADYDRLLVLPGCTQGFERRLESGETLWQWVKERERLREKAQAIKPTQRVEETL